MSKVIIISGKQGSGKTTLSKKLDAYFGTSAEQIKFATTLYKIHNFAMNTLREAGVPAPKKDGEFLQWLGTEYGRKKYGDNVWANITAFQASNSTKEVVIIDDCRFQNEFHVFPNALLVRLRAPEHERASRADGWRNNTNHQSETDLDALENEFDLVLSTGLEGLNADQVFEAVVEAFNKKFA